MSKFMISCDEATTISDKNQYVEATFWERAKLGFHLMMCKSCRVYDTQNVIVTKIIDQKNKAILKESKDLTPDEKSVIQDNINTKH